jgi:hypothetical protein
MAVIQKVVSSCESLRHFCWSFVLFHQAINSCTVTFEIARIIYCHYDITVLKEKSLAGKPKETTDHHISIALTFQLRAHFNCAHISIALTFQLRSHFNCAHISIALTFQLRAHFNCAHISTTLNKFTWSKNASSFLIQVLVS